jgi:hypothetical protein
MPTRSAESSADPCPQRTVERRRQTRRPAGGLAGRVGFTQPLRLLDLSQQGARVRTAEALAPGRRYHFQVGGLHLTAAVARCALVALEPDEEGARPVFEAGIAFEPLAAAQRRQLRQVLGAIRVAPAPHARTA